MSLKLGEKKKQQRLLNIKKVSIFHLTSSDSVSSRFCSSTVSTSESVIFSSTLRAKIRIKREK